MKRGFWKTGSGGCTRNYERSRHLWTNLACHLPGGRGGSLSKRMQTDGRHVAFNLHIGLTQEISLASTEPCCATILGSLALSGAASAGVAYGTAAAASTAVTLPATSATQLQVNPNGIGHIL